MSTSLIALNNYRALLYTTLDSYEVLEFVEYAITKRMMSHLERDKIIEAQTTTKKIDSFIRFVLSFVDSDAYTCNGLHHTVTVNIFL